MQTPSREAPGDGPQKRQQPVSTGLPDRVQSRISRTVLMGFSDADNDSDGPPQELRRSVSESRERVLPEGARALVNKDC